MKLLDLYTGTGSVSKIASEMGFEVVTLDIDSRCKPDLCVDVLDFDYESAFKKGSFDVVWASPDCRMFSRARQCNIGREVKGEMFTREGLERDLVEKGLPVLRRTEEIIEYLSPSAYFIENPATGRMKDYIEQDKKRFVFDYCMYGFPYRKRTHVWSNLDLEDVLCDKSHLVDGKHEMSAIGSCKTQRGQGGGNSKKERDSIPPLLVRQLLEKVTSKV